MKIKMDNLWIRCLYFGLIFSITAYGQSEFEVQLVVPKYIERGSSVTMQCKHNVRPDILFKVTWLKLDMGKFFEYIKGRNPPFRNSTVDGAEIDWENSNETQVTIKNLDYSATGHYYCEILTNTPIFTKASLDEPVHVILPQTGPPSIKFRKKSPLVLGEKVLAMCNTTRARPAPHITWLINGKKVDEKYVRTLHHSTSGRSIHRQKSHQISPTHLQQPPVYQPPIYQQRMTPYEQHQPNKPHPVLDVYDSLRIINGNNQRRIFFPDEVFPHNHHHRSGTGTNNGWVPNINPHEFNHRDFDNTHYDNRKHRNSYNRKKRRYVNEGNGNNRYINGGLGSGSGSGGGMGGIGNYVKIVGSGGGPLNPHQMPGYPQSNPGQYTVSQLNMEIGEQHIGSNGRLEITCLATIPAHVGPGEQYADYKTYSVKVDVEKPELTSTTTQTIDPAARGNGSLATSIHTLSVPTLFTCFSLVVVLSRVK